MATIAEISRCKAYKCIYAGENCIFESNLVINSKGLCSGIIIISSYFGRGKITDTRINKCMNEECTYYRDNEKCGSRWIPFIDEEGKCNQFLEQYIPVTPMFFAPTPLAA